MSITIRPLSPFGAEVIGLDLDDENALDGATRLLDARCQSMFSDESGRDLIDRYALPEMAALFGDEARLATWLEVDIAFTPVADFGPLGPSWQTVFGETVELVASAQPSLDEFVGHAWHHALHARACIERGRYWQAEYWISGLRDQIIALACLRLGQTTSYAKGAHLVPREVVEPLEAGLVRGLDEAELRRALAAAAVALAGELEESDGALANRLRPMLRDVTGWRPPSDRALPADGQLIGRNRRTGRPRRSDKPT